MKILGSELNQFVEEAWPSDDWYWDHDEFEEQADSNTVYDTDFLGDLYYQGPLSNQDSLDLETLIIDWRRAKTHDQFTVTIPVSQVTQFMKYLASIGGTIK